MPALPRPFSRRDIPPQPAVIAAQRGEEDPPLPPRRPVDNAAAPTAKGSPPPAAAPARKSIWDRLFPIKPGTPVPQWSRVVNLIILMVVVWEVFSFADSYLGGVNLFGGGMPAHDATAAWQATLTTLPIALLLASLGSVPGFWLMRRRVLRANAVYEEEQRQRRSQAHQRASGEAMSSRARRRHAAKRGGTRR